MFFDRDKATQDLRNQLSTCEGWIVVSGDLNIGKTAFVKNAVTDSLVLYCEPLYELDYMREFCKQISNFARDILINFANKKIYISNKYNELVKTETGFINDLSDEEVSDCIERIIKKELSEKISYFARTVGSVLKSKVNYIVIDNLFNCDVSFYEWFVSLSEKFTSKNNHIIAVCDTNTIWKSDHIKCTFNNMFSPISINKFDDEEAYFQLLNHKIYFNNDFYTRRLSKILYHKFDGNSLKIFQLIDLALNKIESLSSDDEREKVILKESDTIEKSIFNSIIYLQRFILSALAICPISLTAKQIGTILEHPADEIKKETLHLISKNLILCEFNIENNETFYRISTTFSRQDFINLVDSNMIFYIQKKLYSMHKNDIITLSARDYTEIAIKIKSSDLYSIVKKYRLELISIEDDELLADIINKTINSTKQVFDYLKNSTTAKLLYRFGWYQNALKVINEVDKENQFSNYDLLMKKGDIQHLLLHPQTADTYKFASEINGITTNQKLSAINRQIMAMTQQNQDGLIEARELYKRTIKLHIDNKCNGLIELYRNANNIFNYDEAMQYTIKGYRIACELGNDIEKIKCMHNICMLDLYNNSYLKSKYKLDFNPSFETVFKEITKLGVYRHETAYPLLDMGTVEMFTFNNDQNPKYLQKARTFYSQAQLYAKSFYAINIAKMGLLVVNSYLYKDIAPLQSIRTRFYNEYESQKYEIKDFRVHRKILFSLATSSLITKDYDEGIKYLLESKKHVFEGEILRFNNLCDAFKLEKEIISTENVDYIHTTEYHRTIKFVPWLISFGH